MARVNDMLIANRLQVHTATSNIASQHHLFHPRWSSQVHGKSCRHINITLNHQNTHGLDTAGWALWPGGWEPFTASRDIMQHTSAMQTVRLWLRKEYVALKARTHPCGPSEGSEMDQSYADALQRQDQVSV